MRPDPALLQRLARSRLLPRRGGATVGFGERRSQSKGAGMEFVDYRAYQPGDDLRRLDPHLRARLGENFVRQYAMQRQMAVTILIDKSASMSASPDRERYATALAALLGFTALAGGDVLRFGFCASGTVTFSPRFEGLARAGQSFECLGQAHEAGGSFRDSLAAVPIDRQWQGLTLIISDFWDEIETEISRLASGGQELWCLHLETPEEGDPALLGADEIRMIDAESGEETDLVLDSQALGQYHIARNAWRAKLRTHLENVGGIYVPHSSAVPLPSAVQSWRELGLIA